MFVINTISDFIIKMATPNVEDDTITYIVRIPFILLMFVIMMIGTLFLGWWD